MKSSWKLGLIFGSRAVIATNENITEHKMFPGKNYNVLQEKLGKYIIENDINNLNLAKLLNI